MWAPLGQLYADDAVVEWPQSIVGYDEFELDGDSDGLGCE
jgi:hypothetical protein